MKTRMLPIMAFLLLVAAWLPWQVHRNMPSTEWLSIILKTSSTRSTIMVNMILSSRRTGDRKWDGRKYKSKINHMAYAISQLTTSTTPEGPAVIGVSEIENRSVLEDLVAAEPIRDRGMKVIHHDSPGCPWRRRGSSLQSQILPSSEGYQSYPAHQGASALQDARPDVRGRSSWRQQEGICPCGYHRQPLAVAPWRREGRAAGFARPPHLYQKRSPICSMPWIRRWVSSSWATSTTTPSTRACRRRSAPCAISRKYPDPDISTPSWEKLDRGIGSYIYRGGWNLFDQIIVNSNLVDGV